MAESVHQNSIFKLENRFAKFKIQTRKSICKIQTRKSICKIQNSKVKLESRFAKFYIQSESRFPKLKSLKSKIDDDAIYFEGLLTDIKDVKRQNLASTAVYCFSNVLVTVNVTNNVLIDVTETLLQRRLLICSFLGKKNSHLRYLSKRAHTR